jgi:hypothetical protein
VDAFSTVWPANVGKYLPLFHNADGSSGFSSIGRNPILPRVRGVLVYLKVSIMHPDLQSGCWTSRRSPTTVGRSRVRLRQHGAAYRSLLGRATAAGASSPRSPRRWCIIMRSRHCVRNYLVLILVPHGNHGIDKFGGGGFYTSCLVRSVGLLFISLPLPKKARKKPLTDFLFMV